jgi:cytochrome c peroxidase
MGLQVVEEYIYPHIDTLHQKELIASVSHLATNTDYLISYYADHSFADWRILDAAKLEVFRIVSLGITGFDAALSLNSIDESAVSLKSLQQV